MKTLTSACDNQSGAAMVIVMMVLALITIAGVMSTRTSITELQISTSDQVYKISFYSAEAARAHVLYNSDLYGSDNIEPSSPVGFPDAANSSIKKTLGADSNQSYNGQVTYLNASLPPRGTGFQVGKFMAHNYQMSCIGYGPRDSKTEIETGFYRIGF